jgi:hypothetical protein
MADALIAPKTDTTHRIVMDATLFTSLPRPPGAFNTPEAVLAQALEFCARKMGLDDTKAAVDRLRQGESDAFGYCLYSIAKQVADRIGSLDEGVRAAYLLDYDATPEDICFGKANVGKPIIHMIIWTERKTAALNSLLAALDRGLVQAYAELLRTSQPGEPASGKAPRADTSASAAADADAIGVILDAQVVDDTEVESRTGYAGLLFSIHHRPIQIWGR